MQIVRRLIEVDLPIAQISAEARREKSIRHGNISTLHIWWARRPLAACRAVLLAALLPDPVDSACPAPFLETAIEALSRFRDQAGGPPIKETPEDLQGALLGFVARFSASEASMDPIFLECARALVAGAHPEGAPLVVDPFAGGGAIPFEALRIGAEAWAGDYNPVATLLLKNVIEDMIRYGDRLADAMREYGASVREQVQSDLGRFYPADDDGAVPIAYLWARTVSCEGPGCGAEIPLLRQLWVLKKGKRSVALKLLVDPASKQIDFELEESPRSVGDGTVKRGSAVCPVCHLVTPVARVRVQAKARGGLPSRLVAVVRTYAGKQGRFFRAATERDEHVVQAAGEELARRFSGSDSPLSPVPDEPVPVMSGVFNAPIYGLTDWGKYYLPRQALVLSVLVAAVKQVHDRIVEKTEDSSFARAVTTSLALCIDRAAENLTTLCRWNPTGAKVQGTFGRQALPMVWDFAEANPFGGSVGDWDSLVENWSLTYETTRMASAPGQVFRADARRIPLPDASAMCVFTDPPYYNAVPYADLSDFFYVWLRRSIGEFYPELFESPTAPKDGEICEMVGWDPVRYPDKDKAFFEREMAKALGEIKRILEPDGIAVIVFAHATTSGWEAMLEALNGARLQVTGSWPLDTEMGSRLRARDSAVLASSVHIVCRPRPDRAGVGDWRQVRGELEHRVGEWLPRLSQEGVEGADAIFACLGPAMEVYSRFERVETAAGDPVPLSVPDDDPDAPAFLPAVWAAVAKEALRMIFEGPEAEGFEEDARLTALWLWTLRAALNGKKEAQSDDEGEDSEEESKPRKLQGLVLDYDTARKLAQALGAHLEELDRPGGIVEVKKALARLVPVAERRKHLLGESATPTRRGGTLFDAGAEAMIGPVEPGETALDRAHQAMLLFADGRGDVLRRLLAEPGFAQDARFRRLAQALSSLYPSSAEEKRWVDGVLGVARQMGG